MTVFAGDIYCNLRNKLPIDLYNTQLELELEKLLEEKTGVYYDDNDAQFQYL